MKPIFTSLTPNAQSSDIILNLIMLTAPRTWQTGKNINELENSFRKFLGVEKVFSFDSGRTSLFAILKSLHLEPESEVLLQAYTCVAVPDPVLWAKLTPIYVDIESETLNMSATDLERKITPKSKVLIIQHTFGFPADLEKLLAVAKAHNLFVIEDCAHALGATYKTKPVGSFGDAAFFSFGRDKAISSTFGGMVVTKDAKLANNLEGLYKSFPFPSRAWIAKQLLHPFIMTIAKATFNFLGLGKAILYLSKTSGLTLPPVFLEEKSGGRPPFVFHRLANALANSAMRQFQKLDLFNSHRRQIAISYEVSLRGMGRRQTALPGTAPIYLRYVIRHPNSEAIIVAAKKENINLGDWYTTAVAPVGVDYSSVKYDPATCPSAEIAAKETLNLPTDIHITEADAQRIIAFLNSFLSLRAKRSNPVT